MKAKIIRLNLRNVSVQSPNVWHDDRIKIKSRSRVRISTPFISRISFGYPHSYNRYRFRFLIQKDKNVGIINYH